MRVLMDKGIKKGIPSGKEAEKQKAIIADGLLSLNLMVPGSLSNQEINKLIL